MMKKEERSKRNEKECRIKEERKWKRNGAAELLKRVALIP
jgi:hypothetical protein